MEEAKRKEGLRRTWRAEERAGGEDVCAFVRQQNSERKSGRDGLCFGIFFRDRVGISDWLEGSKGSDVSLLTLRGLVVSLWAEVCWSASCTEGTGQGRERQTEDERHRGHGPQREETGRT